jgi:hypothetical protein
MTGVEYAQESHRPGRFISRASVPKASVIEREPFRPMFDPAGHAES